ncbi:MAG TPA: 30S ribosomal protein S9 [Candidatus Woesebacteria bacterium]|nr:30S ribosomal protein S9 [Candidatus Woesebacteria bacterium]
MNKKNTKAKKIIKKIITPVSASKKKSTEVDKSFKIPKSKYFEAMGRRKSASARVRIYEGSGDLVVNDTLIADYFAGVRNAATIYMKPFELTGTKGKFSISAKITGSGINAQIEALANGLAKALVAFNPELRTFLKPAGLLTRDDRMKETRKIGMGGKARRKRQSPKR